MAELDVHAAFLMTTGRGAGPETWMALSVSSADGQAVPLDLPRGPGTGPAAVRVFIALSAMFGASGIPLRVVEVLPQETGFYALRVEVSGDLGVRLEQIRPATLGVVVDNGQDRGQALACSCPGAGVTPWLADQVRPPRL